MTQDLRDKLDAATDAHSAVLTNQPAVSISPEDQAAEAQPEGTTP